MNWVKLNKKATNLPLEDCYCWLRIKDEDGEYYIVIGQYTSSGKHFYWNRVVDITHYFVIEKPEFP